MKRFKFIGSNSGYFWDILPITGNEYSEDELRKMYDLGWSDIIENLKKDHWEEVTQHESGWISVEDRLPGHKQEVICYDGVDVFTGIEYSEKYGFQWLESGYEPENISHWMPLPKPPIKTN